MPRPFGKPCAAAKIVILSEVEGSLEEPRITQSGEAAAKDLTTDYADYTDMHRSECVHGILHCLPACVREGLSTRERFRSWECEASSHRFSINGLLPQKRHIGHLVTARIFNQ